MNGIDLDYTDFECRKIKKRVIITSMILPVGNSKQEEAAVHAIEAFDCNHKSVCGVLIQQGEQPIYNWQACVHPELFAKKTERAGYPAAQSGQKNGPPVSS